MRLLFTSLLSLFLSFSLFGQGWEQVINDYGEQVGSSIQQTIDGGYIICGTNEIGPFLLKTSSSGTEIWYRTYGDYNSGQDVQQTADGGYIICGYSNVGLFILKTNDIGEETWSHIWGDDYGSSERSYSVQQTTDLGYIICGRSNGGVYLIKTNDIGEEIWSNIYDEQTGTYSGVSVQQTINGGYIICGHNEYFLNGDYPWVSDVYLLRTNESGDVLWSNVFGSGYNCEGREVQQTTDGGYIICGTKGYTIDLSEIGDIYLIKTHSNGDEMWSNTYGGNYQEYGHSVQQTIDGGYIICGTRWGYDVESDPQEENYFSSVYLIKTDQNGEEQWSNTYGIELAGYFAQGKSVQQTADGGYIITGSSRSDMTDYEEDVYIIKTDSEGTLSYSSISPNTSNRKLDKLIDALGREVNHTTNQILFHIYDDGSVEKKFIVE